jgi:organic hydroperoxide reductase OsmC/OhrA
LNQQHHYTIDLNWTGNLGAGTNGYTQYSRNHEWKADGKPVVHASADPVFRGDATRYNPEELLLAALSSCHMLWYLHLCADAGIVVTAYEDHPTGILQESSAGGKFVEVLLKPRVTITDSNQIPRAQELHREAHKQCFIANSCNFPVKHEPVCTVG